MLAGFDVLRIFFSIFKGSFGLFHINIIAALGGDFAGFIGVNVR